MATIKKRRWESESSSRPRSPPSSRAASEAGGGFSFGFFSAGSAEDASEEPETARARPCGRVAAVRRGHPDEGEVERVRVLWEESTHRFLMVQPQAGDPPGPFSVKPHQLLACPEADTSEGLDGCIRGGMEGPVLRHLDPTFEPPSSNGPWTVVPPAFEPSLASLVWPVKPEEFLSEVYGKKALVVQGTGERLCELRSTLQNLRVPSMLADASKVIVWMKAADDGRMQYIDAGADVALSCYRAGHSLYFNPSLEVQRALMAPLTRDLGMGFAASLDGGMGGDVEVFAVKGRHVTPWHFDGQENFTIQLRGCKRWSLARSDLRDPLTNYHPATSNTGSRLANRVLHRSYSRAALPPHEFDGQQSVLLRPGSFLYLPGGMWHRVESLGDHEEGSLSINFSVDGARWGDVVLRCLQPLLWRSERARERVRFSSPSEARDAVAGVLSSLRQAMEGLEAASFRQQLVPEAVLSDRRPARVVVVQAKAEEEEEEEDGEESEADDDDGGAEARRRTRGERSAVRAGRWQAAEGLKSCGGALRPDHVLRRNPLCVLLLESEDEQGGEEEERRLRRAGRVVSSVHYGFERDQASGQVGLGGHVVKLEVPSGLAGLMRRLEELSPEDSLTVEVVRRLAGQQEAEQLVDAVVGVLLFQGYVVVSGGESG